MSGLWATEIISRFRYKARIAFLNVVDPVAEDPSNKCINNCSSYRRILLLSVDERMVKSRNRPGIRQFMKDKPTKWGIKICRLLQTVLNGYTCYFDIYTWVEVQRFIAAWIGV